MEGIIHGNAAVLDMLKQHMHGHHFGHGSRFCKRIAFFVQKNSTGIEIHDEGFTRNGLDSLRTGRGYGHKRPKYRGARHYSVQTFFERNWWHQTHNVLTLYTENHYCRRAGVLK